uniref:Transcription factor HES-5 n=1 Tax=Fundulus heteroclitus TaxID=8078 RepID=A0A3Q2SS48_FUNHE
MVPQKSIYPFICPTQSFRIITFISRFGQDNLSKYKICLTPALFLFLQLRKPLVEKLRRERINSSIEQLKSLLGPEFLKQQPDSKLEKADILEMTVCFLSRLQQQQQQQQQHPDVGTGAADQGYSRCVREVAQFLSKDQLETKSQRRLLDHFNKQQTSSDKNLKEADFSSLNAAVQRSVNKENNPINSALWRPW